MTGRTPPQNMEAEQSLLGALLVNPANLDKISLRPEEFYRPAHELVLAAISALHKAGRVVDPITVSEELERRGHLERIGGMGYLAELVSPAFVSRDVQAHAAIIKGHAASRRLIDQCTSNLQDAWESTDPVEAKVARAEARIREVPTSEPSYTATVMSLDEFCDQPVPDNDWVIPGLLARGDRLVLTGAEGLGKSVLMRQFAISAAAGVHPFTYRPIPPMTALFVDAENPSSIMIRSFGGMRDAVRRNRGTIDEKRLWIERTPAGLTLGNPQDQLWLQRLVSLINPDLLCIGPAYKLFRGSSKDKEEDLAREVTSVLDTVRSSVNCALILEHHAGHGSGPATEREMRPRGSSLWLAWPEFGFGIRAAKNATKNDRLVDFIPWRGEREERDWPTQLAKGTSFMPWMDASYT